MLGGGFLVLLAMATYIIATYIIALNKVRPPKTNERLVSEPPPVSPKAGPPFPVPDAPRPDAPRPFVGDRDILAAIRNNLVSTPLTDRPFQRYFTLANLHNNRKVLDYDLRLSRGAGEAVQQPELEADDCRAPVNRPARDGLRCGPA